MEGSKTFKERLYLINNVDKLFFNSKWSQKRFFLNFKDPKFYLDKTCSDCVNLIYPTNKLTKKLKPIPNFVSQT